MLLVDDGGWHVARALVVPPGIVLHALPPCTPGLPPVEPLRPLARGAVASKGFADPDERGPVPGDRCRRLIDHPELVRGAVGFARAAALDG